MSIEKKYLRNILLLIVIGFLTYAVMSFFQGFEKIESSFLNYKFENFLYAFFVICISWFVEACMLKIVTGKIKKISFLKNFRIAMITQFFNLITPFYTGGQPFTVYYYSKEGIDYEKSIAAILYKTYTFQIAISLLATISLVFSWFELNEIMIGFVFMGILINAGMAFFMFLIGHNGKIGIFVVNFIMKILRRIKLIKNFEKVKSEIEHRTTEFHSVFKEFGKQRKLFFRLTILNVLNYSLYALSAVLILRGIGLIPDLNVFNRTVMLNISASAVPTPGTSGGIEGIYFLFLNGMAENNDLTLGVFLWRIASYYLSILCSGLFVFKIFSKEKPEIKT